MASINALIGLLGKGLTGDWKKAIDLIGGEAKAEDTLKRAKVLAIKRAAAFAARKIVENLNSSGALAGAPFAPLADSTVARRKKGRNKGAGNKPLIDTGDMRGSVHPHFVDENTAFAGLKRGSVGKEGKDRADIAMIHEYGALKKVTGGAMHVEEAIPARPFVGPVLEKFAPDMGKVYAESMEKSFEKVDVKPEMPVLETT